MKLQLRSVALSLSMFALNVHAACPSDVDAAALGASQANLQPAPNAPAHVTMADAICGPDKFTHIVLDCID
ncbi:MAG: hypothetical protein H0V63_08975 [Burkholderiaceae bacterium]|nr:hypothetical protein [Burkholderiaceae bacterium]